MTPTRTQRLAIKRLAAGWIMDRSGRSGLGAVLLNSRDDPTMTLTQPTVSTLFLNGWIETAVGDVTDFRVTRLGLEAAGIQPEERNL